MARFLGAPELLEGDAVIADRPAKYILRLTLNRPHRRNALTPKIRAQLCHQLHLADSDPTVRVTIIRGAGMDFCAGYDVSFEVGTSGELFSDIMAAPGDGQFQRGAVETVLFMWDLKKPVIAQVHGHCLAGGSEIASGADLVYVAETVKVGYPPVRSMGCPDTQYMPWLCGFRKGMELMLTGDTMNGPEAVASGWAVRWFADDKLEAEVMKVATKLTRVPADIQQVNKRSVHRGMEIMGIRTALRYGTELQALVMHTQDSSRFMRKFRTSQTPHVEFRYYRFTPTKLRNGTEGDEVAVVHVDRFQLRHKQKNVRLPDQIETPCAGRHLVIQFAEPHRVDELSFTTAAEEPGLDPIRWKFEGSDDGEKWIVLQDKSDMDWPTPTKRLYTSGVLGLDGGAASRAFSERDKAFGDNRVARQQAKL
jgi:enoyl-CoA hydratase